VISLITRDTFTALVTDGCSNRSLPLLWQLDLLCLWISDRNVSPPACISFAGISLKHDDYLHLSSSMEILTSKELESGTNGSAVCTSASLTFINPKYIIYLTEAILSSIQNNVWTWSTSSFSSFTKFLIAWKAFLNSCIPPYKPLIFLFLLLVSPQYFSFGWPFFKKN